MKDYQVRILNQMNEILKSGKKIILQRPRCNGRIMSRHYFLNPDHTYRPCDLMTWATQFENTEERRIAEDKINDCYVSTVWLGLNHNWLVGPPLLFETMIFQGHNNNIYQNRYATWEQAEIGHKKAIEWVKNGCKNDE